MSDHLGHVLDREVGIDLQDERRERHQRHEIETLVRVVLHVAGQGRVYDQRRAAGVDRVAVGCDLGDVVRCHGGGGAGAVVDQDRLAELGLHFVGIDAGHRIVEAARRIRHDHGDRLGGPIGWGGLRHHSERQRGGRERAREER
jgi:hypothetical protein